MKNIKFLLFTNKIDNITENQKTKFHFEIHHHFEKKDSTIDIDKMDFIDNNPFEYSTGGNVNDYEFEFPYWVIDLDSFMDITFDDSWTSLFQEAINRKIVLMFLLGRKNEIGFERQNYGSDTTEILVVNEKYNLEKWGFSDLRGLLKPISDAYPEEFFEKKEDKSNPKNPLQGKFFQEDIVEKLKLQNPIRLKKDSEPFDFFKNHHKFSYQVVVDRNAITVYQDYFSFINANLNPNELSISGVLNYKKTYFVFLQKRCFFNNGNINVQYINRFVESFDIDYPKKLNSSYVGGFKDAVNIVDEISKQITVNGKTIRMGLKSFSIIKAVLENQTLPVSDLMDILEQIDNKTTKSNLGKLIHSTNKLIKESGYRICSNRDYISTEVIIQKNKPNAQNKNVKTKKLKIKIKKKIIK